MLRVHGCVRCSLSLLSVYMCVRMPLNLRSIVGVPSGHFVCIQFSQNFWKRLAQLEQHSRNGPWTRNQSFSWMLLYVRVVNTPVVSPFEVPGRDASEANKEKNKTKISTQKKCLKAWS